MSSGMALAAQLADFVYAVDFDRLEPRVLAQARTLIIDALACTIAGTATETARIALSIAPHRPGPGATVVRYGHRTSASAAALVNGAMMRALDMTDTYVGRDVCHPGEIIPTALACAEAAGASGRALLEGIIAGLTLHMQIADTIALHRHTLHHTGQAAWVVPLVAARLLGHGPAVAAQALTIGAHSLIVPESFGRGQLTNLKAFAYPLLARAGIDAVPLAAAGLSGSPRACEDVVALLIERFGMDIAADDLVPKAVRDNLDVIMLKTYPAQYTLQPLIAAAVAAHVAEPQLLRRLDRVIVRASRRTIERAADPAKYAPASPEAADHSLPFCIAAALIDGELTPDALEHGRWRDTDVLELMARIETEAIGEDDDYAVGPQEIVLVLRDGTTMPLQCPPQGMNRLAVAERKLRGAARHGLDPDEIMTRVAEIDRKPDVRWLMGALVPLVAA
jgi:2-methylcitrate dehydratase